MKNIVVLITLIVLCCPAYSENETEQIIDRLLKVTKAEQTVESTFLLVEKQMRQAVSQATGGKTLSHKEEKILNKGIRDFINIISKEFSWELLKPIYIRAYSETFSKKELKDIVNFYDTESGKAYASKLPVLSEKMTEATQAHLQKISPRIRPVLRMILEEMGALE